MLLYINCIYTRKMSKLLSLGAINKVTSQYVYPKIANKKDKYICHECNKDLILVQGKIRLHHFRHKIDSINPCHHYSKPTESQIHKDAKMLLKTLLENKKQIQFVRQCVWCKISVEITLPEITEHSIITLEHRFNYEDELKIADVAHTVNGEIKTIYEICNTHKTCSEDRPEPWVEIDAKSLLILVNTNNKTVIINCIRYEKCEDCIEKEKIQLKKKKNNCKKDRSECYACRGTGISYWSDDVYGSCLECCCMNCKKFIDKCKCKDCKKCNRTYMKNEKHKCSLCEKCGNYIEYDDPYMKDGEHQCYLCECGKYREYKQCLKDHCRECCNCKD